MLMMKKVLCVMVACMVVAAPYAEAAITSCGQVFDKMKPCLDYLRRGGSVPAVCCNAVRGLNSDSKSTADRKLACGCIKTALSAFAGINPDNALRLPGKCGVNFPYTISPKTDCSKYVQIYTFFLLSHG
ncbi:non-specific lipid-transfer protein 1-like [Cynara cardunculus var. scolymus]|uniref:Non-specific lipid-transfer protein n=1 Tax=Cynara cardunculus var. scolymus TaxID=59895 RepID=A0A103XQG9_CYNCS|nr:non-specific lipid-transfer protein 1-like [Cynara cardunculus var. scolymus]KVH95031.1 Bifunctional inhibitor/plant lipid transfer protein/seed storage helical domain-containing protein [Cynara cardunculus var. scolymus]